MPLFLLKVRIYCSHVLLGSELQFTFSRWMERKFYWFLKMSFSFKILRWRCCVDTGVSRPLFSCWWVYLSPVSVYDFPKTPFFYFADRKRLGWSQFLFPRGLRGLCALWAPWEGPQFCFPFTQCLRFWECLLLTKRICTTQFFLLLDLGPERETDQGSLFYW